MLSLGGPQAKMEFLTAARRLDRLGLALYATAGTARFLEGDGLRVKTVFKESERRSPSVVETLRARLVDLVINIPEAYSDQESRDGYLIRRTAVDLHIPLFTNLQLARLLVKALLDKRDEDLLVKPWSAYVPGI
jgi:carbamoyl-phosphate synthase large subunit